MRRAILTALVLIAAVGAVPAQARVATLWAQQVSMPIATMHGVQARMSWPDAAAEGVLELRVDELASESLGYRFRQMSWSCPLRRTGGDGWSCEGTVRARGLEPARLSVRLAGADVRAELSQKRGSLRIHHSGADPDRTTLDLTQVPLAWTQALLAQAWPEARLGRGNLGGQLSIETPRQGPLRVTGQLQARNAALESTNGTVAAEGLGADIRFDYAQPGNVARVSLHGTLQGGQFLAGSAYVALPAHPVALQLEARAVDGAWELPAFSWDDRDALRVTGSARFARNGDLAGLDAEATASDLSPLPQRYLSGWLGPAGLAELALAGTGTADLTLAAGRLQSAGVRLGGADIRDGAGRFAFHEVAGDLRFSAGSVVESRLHWADAQLYGLPFASADLPFSSADGLLRSRAPIRIGLLGGTVELHDLLVEPQSSDGLDLRVGLRVADVDFGKVAGALGLPAFQGTLSGDLPVAHFRNDRIDFEGGLEMGVFDGRIAVSGLAVERPFGSAPSLSADIAIDDLNLLRLTEVLGVGSITGRLDGRINGLRLVAWSPVAFDARFITDAAPGVRQRISQRAVQNIGSVGDASFVTSLQGQLIGIFSDFGYRRIGVGCRLENGICAMSGLHSAGNAFTIVEGKGLPRLTVVGYNRAVDWQTLVERLLAVGKGDVAPVIK